MPPGAADRPMQQQAMHRADACKVAQEQRSGLVTRHAPCAAGACGDVAHRGLCK